MSTLSRALLQLVTAKDIEAILKLDAPELSSSSSFIEDNMLGAYVLINTWLLIIKQVSEYGWKYVLTHMQKYGLIRTIREFDTAADELVHGVDLTFSLARVIMVDIERGIPIIGIPVDNERNLVNDSMAAALSIFRYPKRFSPVGADLLKDKSIKTFVDTQNRLKLEQRQSHSRFIIERVREAMLSILNWDRLVADLIDVDITDIVFTPGVSFDTNSLLISKLRSIAKEHVEYFYMPFGIPLVANQGVIEPEYTQDGREIHTVRLVVVPKNYKTGRVIAPENVYRQALARRFFTISDRYLPESVKLHDQTQNQRLALHGSITGLLSTIDLSMASDSLTPTLIREIFPGKFVDVIDRVLPNRYEYNGKSRILHSAATMGNSMTFWLESVCFLAISKAAVDFYNIMSGEIDDTISIYGDDIIVPTGAALTVIEWLESLGFIVNREKSFYDPNRLYRESCGEEFYNGINVSSRYFPRFPLVGQLGRAFSNFTIRDGFTGTMVDTMASLVDLQRKLFLWCIPASLLVESIIKQANSRMTSSVPDENFVDLLSYESLPVLVPAPCGTIEDGKLKKLPGRSEYLRAAHLTPISVYDQPKVSPTDMDEVLVNLYNYQNFLKYGPRYDDELSKLLGISSPPVSISEACGLPRVKWVLVK